MPSNINPTTFMFHAPEALAECYPLDCDIKLYKSDRKVPYLPQLSATTLLPLRKLSPQSSEAAPA